MRTVRFARPQPEMDCCTAPVLVECAMRSGRKRREKVTPAADPEKQLATLPDGDLHHGQFTSVSGVSVFQLNPFAVELVGQQGRLAHSSSRVERSSSSK